MSAIGRRVQLFTLLALCTTTLLGCSKASTIDVQAQNQAQNNDGALSFDEPEYFLLRPEVENAYGYAHAVKIGNHIKVSGAVSMDDSGNPTAVGDMAQQMINVYVDLDKVLSHYGYSFDDVVVENVFTTDMNEFIEVSSYRNSIYKTHFPTGTWAQVEQLALPEFMIEIELEAYRSH